MKIIKNAAIVLEDRVLPNAFLRYDTRILEISQDSPNEENAEEVLDAQGKYLTAGLIDIHTHGAAGFDVMDSTFEALNGISRSLAKCGVTSFAPTTVSMPIPDLERALDNVRQHRDTVTGAKVLGVNLEGPFISKKKRGCHLPENICSFHFPLIEKYQDVLRLTTIAPELEGAIAFIDRVRKETSIVLSMGHTDAGYQQLKEAVDHGITNATHLFNAMSPLHHREPGGVGTALTEDIYTELIADTIHVHPAIFSLALACKGTQKLVLITDAMCAADMPDGKYSLGGQEVWVKDHAAKLEDGTLAGSVLRLNEGVRNFQKYTRLPIWDAVNLASRNPAALLGEKERGVLAVGNYADLLLAEEDWKVAATVSEGKTIFQ